VGLLFISHSSADTDAALAFCARLRTLGFETLFLDFDPEHGIPAGRNWEEELYIQLRRADAVVFLASPDSVASKWCAVEVSLSRSVGKPVFPIEIRSTPRLPILEDTQWIDFSSDRDAAIERLMTGLRVAGLDPRDSFAWDGTRSPYPGLQAFAPEDAAVFFGRTPEVERVLELLHPTLARGSGRFVAVVGPSGSGKSSLINAGVLPRLARERRQWTILPSIVPGTRPTAHLARSLSIAFREYGEDRTHADLLRRLTEGTAGLENLANELCDLRDTEALLLVVDQAEELSTRAGPAERVSFFDLIDGSLHDGSPVWVLATVRSEFLSGSSSDQKIAEIIDDSIVIEPLSRSRMSEVIELPAQRGGILFAAGLVQRMIEDTVGGDALPLLAYTLLQLYEGMSRSGRIGYQDYEAVGGVIGALQGRADRVMRDLERRGQGELALPVLLKLATIERDGEPTRRRVRLATLSQPENAVVDAFLSARLLKADGNGEEATVEVAHEALLRQWKPLYNALEVARQSIQMRTEVERLAKDWVRVNRADSYLLRGERLESAVNWINDPVSGIDELEREFINASREFAVRELRQARAEIRRLRTFRSYLIGVVVLLVLTTVVATIALNERGVALNERNNALKEAQANERLAVSRQLAAEATSMTGQQLSRSLLLSLAALRVADTAEAQGALLTGLESSKEGLAALTSTLLTHGPSVSAVGISPDGVQVLAASGSQVRIWDGSRVALTLNAQYTVTSLAVSPNGRLLATGSADGTTRFWDAINGRPTGTPLSGGFAPITGVTFTPDGRLAVAGSLDGTVRFWSTSTRRQVRVISLGGQSVSTALAVSPDGGLLATGDQEGNVNLFDIATGQRIGSGRPIRSDIIRLTFSPDGKSLTAVTSTGEAVTWSVTPFRQEGDPLLITTSIISAVGGNGEQLAAGDIHGNIVFWSYTSRWQLGTSVPLYKGAVTSEAYSPDGSTLISGSTDGQVIVWDLAPSLEEREACRIAARNLTAAEWQQFIGNALPRAPLCPVAHSR
jgi:energy-coupling factor transporter ATP-binding protein EcfA2